MLWRIRLFLVAFASILLVQCKAKEIFDQYFTCEPGQANTCGTNREGASMVCFEGSRYGASDFCTDPCPLDHSNASFTCLGPAELRVCNPKSQSGCPAGLTCVDIGGQSACLLGCSTPGGCGDAGHISVLSDGGVPDADGSPDMVVVTPCSGGGNACPTTSEGRPMICVTSSSLGGDDFCAEACDPNASATDPDFRCVATGGSGALLRRCHPNQSDAGAADCLGGLNCFRTSLLYDEGVCMAMPVCQGDGDCTDIKHPTCAATLLRGAATSIAAFLPLDHLNCLLTQCAELNRQCASSEGCLGTQYAIGLADICVPSCDSKLHCPPNFTCAMVVSGDGAQQLCLPGVPGARCDGDNCIFGNCQDTGAGFSVCTTACSSDNDCSSYSTGGDPFVCVQGGAGRHCVTPTPFNGANCQTGDDCRTDAGQFCSFENQFGYTNGHGECRLPCKADQTCDSQGGLPFTCLTNGGGCFPGTLGVPCTLATDCISGLTCQEVPPEPDVTSSSRICTASCAIDGGSDVDGDAICNDPKSIRQRGYCAGGVCRLLRVPGQPCDRATQCSTARCDTGTHLCVNPPTHPSGL